MSCSLQYEEPSSCFFDIHAVVHHQFHPQGKIFNKHNYNATMWDQQQHEWQKQNESGIQGIDVSTTTMQLLTLLCLSPFLTESKMTVIPHHVEQEATQDGTKLIIQGSLGSCWPEFFSF